MITGMMVQMISTSVLWIMLTSGTAPFECRNLISAKIIAPNTTTAMPTQIQNTSMCRPYMSWAKSVTPRGKL
jgi:hypothetical protein